MSKPPTDMRNRNLPERFGQIRLGYQVSSTLQDLKHRAIKYKQELYYPPGLLQFTDYEI